MRRAVSLVVLFITTAVLWPFSYSEKDHSTGEYEFRSGKSVSVTESHPTGQSLSDITIRSSGFEHDLDETLRDRDPISNVYVADLDNNGFEEIYIITVSAGSGSYGDVIGFASNRDRSLSMIHFPNDGGDLFIGYSGHDTFLISGNELTRSFPIYLPSDSNGNPTGGTRRLTYGLFPGEAAWQLVVVDSGDSQ